MNKKFYDIIPEDKRSIRNIPLSVIKSDEKEREKIIHDSLPRETHKHTKVSADGIKVRGSKKTRVEKKEQEDKVIVYKKPETTFYEGRDVDFEEKEESRDGTEETFESWNIKRRSRRVWLIAILLIPSLVYALSLYFSSAKVTIKPVRHDLSLNNFQLSLKDVDFSTIEFDVTATSTIKAGGLTHIERNATGTIVFFNSYSSVAQKLIAGTRLIAPNNLIYKVQNTVVVPGMTTVGGKKVPGTIDINVIAEKTGENYNAPFTDFNVVAFKGTDKYDKIYGRSKTAISGGYVGDVPNISSADKTKALADIKNTLASSTDKEILDKTQNISADESYIPGSMAVIYDDPIFNSNSDGSSINISMHAHIALAILKNVSLAKEVYKENISSTSTGVSEIGDNTLLSLDTSHLKASVPSSVYPVDIKHGLANLYLTGQTSISSLVDPKTISELIVGLSKDRAISTIRDIVEADSIEISTNPWWIGKLPLEAKDIKVLSE